MNTEEAPKAKKKSIVSIPFVLISVLLLALFVPVLPDVDDDSKRDNVGKYILYKLLSSQEEAASSGEAVKGDAAKSDGPGKIDSATADFGDDDGAKKED